MVELAVDGEELLYDVEDRAGRDGEEDDRHGGARPGLAEQRPEEGRAAADQAHQTEEAPARPRPLAAHGPADTEALGRVVEPEADDERDREADLARRGGLADREPLAEVVRTDADRDQQRELLAGREVLEPGAMEELVRR